MAFSYKRKDANDYDNVRLARENLDANSNYKQSDAVTAAIKARDEHAANKIGDWTGGTYGQAVKDALDKINNREKFSYDINGDALYQQYKNQYINQGRLAMADTIGQASAMTGGYGNSYAAAVGNQTYQGYLQKLNDVVPELYQMALNRYNQEGQDLKDNLTINQNLYNTEYGEYRDRVSDWNAEQSRLDSNAYNEANLDYSKFTDNRDYLAKLYSTALDWATNDANTDYNNRFNEYQQKVSEDQWDKSYKLSKAQANQSATIAALQDEVKQDNYYKAIANIDEVPTEKLKARRVKRDGEWCWVVGKKKYNNYTDALDAEKYMYNGKAYDTYEDAVSAYLDTYDLSEAQINDIFDRLDKKNGTKSSVVKGVTDFFRKE